PGRITIKTFLEPLRVLQRRLSYLIEDSAPAEPQDLEAIFKALMKIETDTPNRAPSLDSWEEMSTVDENFDSDSQAATRDIRAPIYSDKDLDINQKRAGRGKDVQKFRLPNQPVQYVPQGNLRLAAEKVLDISPKALFHVLFGDKSAVWQLLPHERNARG